MVNIKDYKEQLIKMANFYIKVPEKVESDADRYNAEIGMKASKKLLKLLEGVGDELKKNQLDALLMSLSRGVEQFEKEEVHQIHLHYGQLRHSIREHLAKVI